MKTLGHARAAPAMRSIGGTLRQIRRALGLPAAERRLLVRAALLLTAIRLGLAARPMRSIEALIAGRPSRGGRCKDDPEMLASAVARAATATGATCLPQALALQALLLRGGHRARVRIGFARTEGGGLSGHAWVESGDHVFGAGAPSFAAARPAGPILT